MATGRSLLFDGAIGTELYKRGLFINRCFEEANLNNRQLILELHRDYREAGAEVLTTNSWGANRYKLRGHNLQEQVVEVNREAARIAREVAGAEAFVAGSVGPLGARMEPWGRVTAAEAFSAFREQIGGLVEGGVDLIILETFADVGEAEQAIGAARAVDSGIPVFACLTLSLQGELELGPSLEEAVAILAAAGADAIGLNCSVGPQPMLTAVQRLKTMTKLPLIVEPNAGLPKSVEGRTIYLSTPEYLANYSKYFLQEGVRYVGGCCGTSPAHIRAMAQAMRQARAMSQSAGPAQDVQPVEAREPSGAKGAAAEVWISAVQASQEAPVQRVPFGDKSNWTAKLAQGKKVATVELLPPAGITADKLLDNARRVREAGIDAINIPDGPRASSRMSAIVSAILIEQRVGIETILHYTCRDRNLIGMQSDMLGAHAIGLRNMLLVTGDPPKLGNYPDATGVFDIDAIGLCKMVHRLNGGVDVGGRPIGEPTALSLGVGVNPGHRDFDFEMGRFAKKVEAGAEWAITQPVFDAAIMEAFLEQLDRRGIRIPIIMGIWPLTSLRNAQFMNNEVPGVEIPESVLERLAATTSPEAAREEGVAIAGELCACMIGAVQGVQVSAPFGRIDMALRIIGEGLSLEG
jgi:homocysteine S-methyltransferase